MTLFSPQPGGTGPVFRISLSLVANRHPVSTPRTKTRPRGPGMRHPSLPRTPAVALPWMAAVPRQARQGQLDNANPVREQEYFGAYEGGQGKAVLQGESQKLGLLANRDSS